MKILRKGYVLRFKRKEDVPREDSDFVLDERAEQKYVYFNFTHTGFFSIYSSDSIFRDLNTLKETWGEYSVRIKDNENEYPFVHFFDIDHPEICKAEVKETEKFIGEL